jgi:iron transport multicopper oxidase
MLQLPSFVFVLAALSGGVFAATVSRSLDIVNREIAPDGYNRLTTLASGTFPGPLIRAKIGDRLKIKVTDKLNNNSLDLATSIHWHGLFQKGSNFADGPSDVTQCPIIPNESFLYDFTVPDQYGTYWYHSHFRAQYCDGLRGALIIDDPNDPQKHLYDFDNREKDKWKEGLVHEA